jgi:hypothetical protein
MRTASITSVISFYSDDTTWGYIPEGSLMFIINTEILEGSQSYCRFVRGCSGHKKWRSHCKARAIVLPWHTTSVLFQNDALSCTSGLIVRALWQKQVIIQIATDPEGSFCYLRRVFRSYSIVESQPQQTPLTSALFQLQFRGSTWNCVLRIVFKKGEAGLEINVVVCNHFSSFVGLTRLSWNHVPVQSAWQYTGITSEVMSRYIWHLECHIPVQCRIELDSYAIEKKKAVCGSPEVWCVKMHRRQCFCHECN